MFLGLNFLSSFDIHTIRFSCYPYSLHLIPAFMIYKRYIIFLLYIIWETLQEPKSESIEEGGTSSTSNIKESNFNISAQAISNRAKKDGDAISELERLMHGKTFSLYVVYYYVCTLVAFQMMLDGNLLPFAYYFVYAYSHVWVITFILSGCLSFLLFLLSFFAVLFVLCLQRRLLHWYI